MRTFILSAGGLTMKSSTIINLPDNECDILTCYQHDKEYANQLVKKDKDFKKTILKQIDILIDIEKRFAIVEKHVSFVHNLATFSKLSKEFREQVTSFIKLTKESDEKTLATIKYNDYCQSYNKIESTQKELLVIKSELDTIYNEISNSSNTKLFLSLYKDIEKAEKSLNEICSKLKKTAEIKELKGNEKNSYIYCITDKKSNAVVHGSCKALLTPNGPEALSSVDEDSAKAMIIADLMLCQTPRMEIITLYAKSSKDIQSNTTNLFNDYLKLPESINAHEKMISETLNLFEKIKSAREKGIALLKSKGRDADIFKLFGVKPDNSAPNEVKIQTTNPSKTSTF